MNLFDLFVKIGVKDEASNKISSLGQNLGNGLKKAAAIGTTAIAAVGAAASALGTAFTVQINNTAQYADNIDKMSQKMGLSAKAYQEWDFIMQHSGTSMEALKAGMKTLANAVDSGNDAFQRLGISQNEIASLNQEELFARTIEELQKVEDTTERTYLAGQLLGRGATELGALLNTSAEDTQKMREQVHELGGVMSDEAVKAGAAYQDSLQNLGVAFDSLGRNLSSKFLPNMVSMMDGLSALIVGDNSGFALIEKGIDDFISNLTDELPKFLELGVTIVENLANAIIKNLPKLAKSGASIVSKLSTTIIKLLPDIIKLGLKLIVSITAGIADAIANEGFIDSIVDVVVEIVKILTDPETLQLLFDSALTLIEELTLGIIDAIPELVDAAIAVVDNLCEFLLNTENWGRILEAGLDIVVALGEAIIKALPKLATANFKLTEKIATSIIETDWSKVGEDIVLGIQEGFKDTWVEKYHVFEGAFSGLIDSAKGIFDIHSPSKVFSKIGENISLGVIEGVEKQEEEVRKAIQNLANDSANAFTSEFNKYFGAFSLFEKPDLEPVSGKELLSNLEDQIDAMHKFTSGVQELSQRTNSNLAAEIEAMGIGALPQLMALLELSDKDLKDYEFAYNQKQRTAMTYAFTEQRGLTTMEELTAMIKSLVERLVSNPFIDPESGEIKLYLDTGALAGGLIDDLDVMLGENFSTNLRGALA